jgi:hypothetical protein
MKLIQSIILVALGTHLATAAPVQNAKKSVKASSSSKKKVAPKSKTAVVSQNSKSGLEQIIIPGVVAPAVVAPVIQAPKVDTVKIIERMVEAKPVAVSLQKDSLYVIVSSLKNQIEQMNLINQKKDSLNSIQMKSWGEGQSQLAQRLQALEAKQALVDSLNQKTKIISTDLSDLRRDFMAAQNLVNLSAAEKLAIKTSQGQLFKEIKSHYESFGFQYNIVTPNFSPSLSAMWSKNENLPKIQLDSNGLMDETDISRWKDWMDRNQSNFYTYGILNFESESYLFGEFNDYKISVGTGWSGGGLTGLDGWYTEIDFGLGYLNASCGTLGSKYTCKEEAFAGSTPYNSIAILTQAKLGWNFIPARYFQSFKGFNIGLHTDMGWRGNWTVANFNDGEFEFSGRFAKYYFGDMATGFLGHEIRYNVGLGYYF